MSDERRPLIHDQKWKDEDVIWWREDIPGWNHSYPIGDLIGWDGELIINIFYNKHAYTKRIDSE